MVLEDVSYQGIECIIIANERYLLLKTKPKRHRFSAMTSTSNIK